MGNLFSSIYPGQQPSEKMADGSKKASGLGMADGSKKASGLGVKPGDLIEISRKCGLYEHWALCVSDDEVVHIVKLSLTKAKIIREKLETVVGSDKWRVNNSLDTNNNPRDVKLILEEAQKMKDKEVSYNIFLENCEHMVTNLRYGQPGSLQAWIAVYCMLNTGWIIPIRLFTVYSQKKKREKGHQRSSTGPTKDGGETVSEEEDEPQYAYELVRIFAVMITIFMALRFYTRSGHWEKGFQRNTCEPTEEGGETVSEEEAIPLHPDTAEFPSMGHGRSTTGPTEESGEEDESESADGDLGCDLPIDKRFLRKIIIPTEKQGVKLTDVCHQVDKEPGEMERREKDEQLMREPVQPEHLLHHE